MRGIMPALGVSTIADRIERRLTAILVADMVGFSAQMEADEEVTLDNLRRWRRELIHPTLERHEGRLVKTTGDGMLVEFASIVDAVAFGVDVQQAVAKRNAASDAPEMLFRIGINLGDVVIEQGDVYGDGVNVAARLEPLAEPGGILVSAAVREQVGDRRNVVFQDAGERTLKNISRPIRTYRVVTGAERPTTSKKGPTANGGKPSIAVLPLDNMSSDPDDEFFADGLTEDILTGLSRFKDLFVISRTSAFVYKGRTVTVQEVAADLGVRFVLEGSVRKAGGRVRVTVQLIDAVADQHVWAEKYDGDLEDIFAMQDKITSAIVATLPGRIEAFRQSSGAALGSVAVGEGVDQADFANPWGVFDNFIDRVVIECVNALTPKWRDRMSGFDVFIYDQCLAMEQSIRVDGPSL